MKKLSFIIIVPLLCSSLFSCNQDETLKHTRVENVDEYTLNVFEPEHLIDPTGETRNYDFFNNRTIPYLSIEEYFDTYGNFMASSKEGYKHYSKYVVFTHDKETTIVNSHNNSRCVIDYNKKTATFDSYSGFLTKANDSSGPGDYISTYLDAYYFLEKTYEHQKGNEVTVNFNDYHIDAYFYDNKIYLPLHFMFTLLGTSSPLGIGGIYYNGHRSYLLGSIELLLNMFDECYQTLLQDIRKDDTTLNADYMQYNYNVLCFALDFHFGLEKRNLRSTNELRYFNKEGAYKTLEPYKTRLLSTKPGEFDDALIELFNNEFNDGGHSYVSPISVTQDKNEPAFVRTGESKNTIDIYQALKEKREEVLGFNLDLEPENQYLEMEYGEAANKTKIAYITFDNFSFSTAKPNIDMPFCTFTFNLINYANEQIRNNNIKNVVIDLSCNTGGVILAEEIIESWICGESHSMEYNTIDKSLTRVKRKADVNFNQKIDEGDFLPSDVNVYCIVSPSSFSCGNLLPSRLKDYSNTKFIGTQSGGGCCSVENYINLPTGAFITISSCNNSVMKDSTLDNIITVEDGITADFIKIEDGEEHYAEYFNRSAINKKIVESLN